MLVENESHFIREKRVFKTEKCKFLWDGGSNTFLRLWRHFISPHSWIRSREVKIHPIYLITYSVQSCLPWHFLDDFFVVHQFWCSSMFAWSHNFTYKLQSGISHKVRIKSLLKQMRSSNICETVQIKSS